MRGTFLASGGVPSVNMDALICDEFGCSRNEARKLIDGGEVKLDGQVLERVTLPVSEVVGHQLSIGEETVEVSG